jgi:hypothetical protein
MRIEALAQLAGTTTRRRSACGPCAGAVPVETMDALLGDHLAGPQRHACSATAS